jgi:RHS repeat-associated protein
VALSYDFNGNRTTRVVTGGSDNGTDSYSYDFENRLIGLVKGTMGGAGTYAYQYDYRTRRIVRDESGASGTFTPLVFSGGTSVQEYNGSISGPTLAVEYLRGSDYGGGVGGILYTVRGGTPSYTHENRRGDVVAKTDGSGSLTYQAQYEGFGNQVASTGTTTDRQKSNSKDTDPTNLVCEGFRYRDLDTGMFINRDPAGFVDGPNLYTYVVQNPWTHFDPEGLYTEAEYDQQISQPTHEMDEAEAQAKKLGATDQDLAEVRKPYEDKIGYDKAQEKHIEETARHINELAGREIVDETKLDDGEGKAAGAGKFYEGLQGINNTADLFYAVQGTGLLVAESGLLDSGGAFIAKGVEAFRAVFAAKGAAGPSIQYLRRKAVAEAWKQEADLVRRTGQGTRQWTEAEKQELLQTGKVKGYEGHHINSVNGSPDQAGNPDNIEFVTRDEHFDKHDGNWQNQTSGDLVNRK